MWLSTYCRVEGWDAEGDNTLGYYDYNREDVSVLGYEVADLVSF